MNAPTQSGKLIRAARGFSLIELLVVIGILGVLAAMILPAVQAAREAARRVQCRNNLKQLGLALHGYAAVWDGFPPATLLTDGTKGSGPTLHFSVHYRLLPYMEQQALYDSARLDVNTVHLEDLAQNQTIAHHVVATFLCPSDPNSHSRPPAPNSYRVNIGPSGEGPEVDGGGFSVFRITRLSDFADGLSSTIALSEKPIGSAGRYSPERDWLDVGLPNAGFTSERWIDICSDLSGLESAHLDSGRTWLLAGDQFTLFTTALPPGSNIPDCGSAGSSSGLFTARSYHPGGVNALMADGSARWYGSGVAREVWRAKGSRRGGEIVTD